MVASAITPTQAVVSVVVVPPQVAVTSVATASATAVVLTTAPHVATSATSSPALNNAANPASMPAKKGAVLTPYAVTTVAVTALSNALLPPTHGTVATTVVHRVKTHARMVHVKVAAGRNVAAITAMQHAPHHAARLATSLHADPSSLAPATSSPTLQRAKALAANVVAPVS